MLLPLDALPLTVISRSIPLELTALSERYTPADTAAFEALWQAAQAEYLALSTQATPISAPESGHNIHLDRPDLVIEAVRAMLAAARG